MQRALFIFSSLIQDKKFQAVDILTMKTEIGEVVYKLYMDGYEPLKLMKVCIWILFEIINEMYIVKNSNLHYLKVIINT